MDDQSFHWGEAIDDKLKFINVVTLTDICKTVPSFYRTSSGRKRKDLYDWIACQDVAIQKEIYERLQQILANPTKETCKLTWMRKRRQEDEQANLRNVRARLDAINCNLTTEGMNNFYI